ISLLTRTCPELDVLLDRDVASEKARESSWYDQLTGGRGQRMVLFGAGNNGRELLCGPRSVGIEPLAFAVNNTGLWQSAVGGRPVFSAEEAGRRFGAEASFIVTIFSQGPGRQYPTIRRQLHALGCTCVVPFGALAWKYPDLFLPHYCLDLPHKIIAD